MITLYTNKKEKEYVMREIIDGDIDIETTDVYIINFSNKYDEPYLENLADIHIGTIPFLINEKNIFFAVKERE